MTPLPKPSVDTGAGLERVAAVLQHVHGNFEIDLFAELISDIAQITGTDGYLQNNSLRVIADHIRSCAFLIVDGVTPSNEVADTSCDGLFAALCVTVIDWVLRGFSTKLSHLSRA